MTKRSGYQVAETDMPIEYLVAVGFRIAAFRVVGGITAEPAA